MKLKQSPEDFRVDELTDLRPSNGPFALYQLEKRGWTTTDAIAVIRRRWNVTLPRISFGGLKDRHAHTLQHLTIEQGPQRNLAQKGIQVTYLGQVPEPFVSTNIQGNRFQITVRDLSSEKALDAVNQLGAAATDGVANYFDDQRFGSVDGQADFIARRAILGDWEGAVRLALTAPYEFDRDAMKKAKACWQRHWGQWSACVRHLPRGDGRIVALHLSHHPTDFRGAFARLRLDQTTLWLSAYQSHLWNAALAHWITAQMPESHRMALRTKFVSLPTPRSLTDPQRQDWLGWSLPLPSARLNYSDLIPGTPPDWQQSIRKALDADGIELENMRLKGLRRPFFSRGERAILSVPSELTHESGLDEVHPGRWKLVLRFILQRGCYATLIVKRVVHTV